MIEGQHVVFIDQEVDSLRDQVPKLTLATIQFRLHHLGQLILKETGDLRCESPRVFFGSEDENHLDFTVNFDQITDMVPLLNAHLFNKTDQSKKETYKHELVRGIRSGFEKISQLTAPIPTSLTSLSTYQSHIEECIMICKQVMNKTISGQNVKRSLDKLIGIGSTDMLTHAQTFLEENELFLDSQTAAQYSNTIKHKLDQNRRTVSQTQENINQNPLN